MMSWKYGFGLVKHQSQMLRLGVTGTVRSEFARCSYGRQLYAYCSNFSEILTVSVLAARTLFVTVRSSYDHRAAPIRLISHRAAPVRCLNRNRTVSVGAPCGLLTSAVRYDPGISHGRRTVSRDMWPRRLRSPWHRTMSEKTTIARRGHYLTVPVGFSTEEPLAVHILKVNGINTNRSVINVVR